MRSHPTTSQPQQSDTEEARSWRRASAGLGHLRKCAGKALGGVVVLLAGLVACSDDKPVGNERAASNGPTETIAAEETAPSSEASTATEPRKYKVMAGTTYFFASPTPASKPTGNYLLRGDVLYGDEVRNGFVRTQFKLPNGATATGWLKQQELGLLASRAAAPASTVQVSTNTPAAPTPNVEPAPAATPAPRTGTVPHTAATPQAVVQVARSYFYNSPDLRQPRKAHCVQGDKVWLGDVQGEAVYVTFTNWEKVTTRGWMRRDALRPVR
ncbi:hypothetical protein HMJ29_14315 [Hymenobacter taeanensis]|uniref:Uncharacterized protein n=1 Tax=Hymenobacter taeanensis TaxID=2735321 RepID=A0A6M6BJJ9_9BACT|nr:MULTISPECIES: hypothetical protein [Hymenobacter]QJX48048.1 hypothetical protein HMJ29_14315 [Hymenobacter taeanensis]UOQ82503.1 hypothetical protein MUN83_06985 [Hymenobacter sp. 5414T-23]